MSERTIATELDFYLFYVLLILYPFFAYRHFNICSTLRFSGQPLTPMSIHRPQEAASDHAAHGDLIQPTRPVTACSNSKARLNTKRASLD